MLLEPVLVLRGTVCVLPVRQGGHPKSGTQALMARRRAIQSHAGLQYAIRGSMCGDFLSYM